MKAAFYASNGGPNVIQYGNVLGPALSPDKVLVQVQLVRIEGGDVISRRLGYLFGRVLLRP